MSSTMDITITEIITDTLTRHDAITDHGWMTLPQLRPIIERTWTRAQLDQALTELHATRQIRLIPEANQKILTDTDRAAALWLGGEYRHLIQLAK